MTIFILSLIVVAQLVALVWVIRLFHEQQKKLIKALMSKDVQEFVQTEIAEEAAKRPAAAEDDLEPFEAMSDEQFAKILEKERSGTS